MIKISVVIPIYNSSCFLSTCLGSVLYQENQNIEIICIDDGSTDNSAQIIKKYCRLDPRIKYFYKNHTNAADARNIGLEFATGDYILFLDSDDFLAEGALKQLSNIATETQADIIVSQYKLFDNKSKRKHVTPYGIHTKKKKPFNIATLIEKQFEFTNIAVWNKLYRSDFLKLHALRFKSHTCLNDMFFSLTATALAKKIALCHMVTVYYRINVHNSISSNISYIQANFFDILEEINVFLQRSPRWKQFRDSLLDLEQQQLFEFATRLSDKASAEDFRVAAINFISQYRH